MSFLKENIFIFTCKLSLTWFLITKEENKVLAQSFNIVSVGCCFTVYSSFSILHCFLQLDLVQWPWYVSGRNMPTQLMLDQYLKILKLVISESFVRHPASLLSGCWMRIFKYGMRDAGSVNTLWFPLCILLLMVIPKRLVYHLSDRRAAIFTRTHT